MKTADQIKPNFSAVYCAALYPELAKIFQQHGYALAVHGSMARDFDVIAVPWAETPSDSKVVLDEITSKFAIRLTGEPEVKAHGRTAYTISVGFGECFIDMSFLATKN